MRHTLSHALRSAGILSLLAIALPFASTGSTALAAQSATHGTVTHLVFKGTTTLGSHTGIGVVGSGNEYTTGPNVDETFPHSGLGPEHTRAAHVPQVAGSSVTNSNPSLAGSFSGINHFDQRNAGAGSFANTNFSLEPPDQGLCTNGTYVLESVNDALAVYGTSGNLLSGYTPLSQFYNLAPSIIRSKPAVYGDFVSDPKCYYDAPTGRWFATALQISTNPKTGDLIAPTNEELAVSQTSDPTGAWYLYQLNTTDTGTSNGGTPNTPNDPNCPCFGDQPLIGADATGFYITTNEFSLGNGFNGAQLYAMSKTALETGVANPAVIHLQPGTLPTPDVGGQWYSVQPATTPPGGSYETAAGGTEYFMSSLQFFAQQPLDNRIAVWALSNTSSLNTTTPSLNLTLTVVDSEAYGQPPNAQQKPGPTPLGDLAGPILFGKANPTSAPLGLLATNDDRMNQVVYANHMLWSGVNTVVETQTGTGAYPIRAGIAYFIVTPSVSSSGDVSATMTNQGYVAVTNNYVMFPAIGVNPSGGAVMTFTLAGPDYYPSAAYVHLSAVSGAGAVHIAGAGLGPDDGFTEYLGGRVGRWGDYSAAVAAPDGSIWLATEYIGQSCTLAQFEQDPTCGGTRTLLANWGTYVMNVTP